MPSSWLLEWRCAAVPSCLSTTNTSRLNQLGYVSHGVVAVSVVIFSIPTLLQPAGAGVWTRSHLPECGDGASPAAASSELVGGTFVAWSTGNRLVVSTGASASVRVYTIPSATACTAGSGHAALVHQVPLGGAVLGLGASALSSATTTATPHVVVMDASACITTLLMPQPAHSSYPGAGCIGSTAPAAACLRLVVENCFGRQRLARLPFIARVGLTIGAACRYCCVQDE